MVIILMGPSGSGKTTIGQALARALGWPFHEGDDFHPLTNVARMRAGVPLTDEDRAPWLDALAGLIQQLADSDESGVIACSALTRGYRERLVPSLEAVDSVRFVYLAVDRDELEKRLEQRRGHFFAASMLDSQLDVLQPPGPDEPAPVFRVDAGGPVDAVVSDIRALLGV